MLRSKALKDGVRCGCPEDKDTWLSKLAMWWYDSSLGKFYRRWKWRLIEKPLQDLKKMWGWYWNVFKDDYDFDAHCLFAIIEYKLKRIQPVLENGHAIQEPKDMKALKIAIKLAGRLKDDNYDMVEYDRHNHKWGELETWFTPVEDKPGYSQWNSSRPKAITPEEKEQERKEMIEGSHRAYARMKREERWLFDILKNHIRNLWD